MTRPVTLEPDLRQDILPISKAASALAALIKQSQQTGRPIIITQKGAPAGVLLSIEIYTHLRTIAAQVEQVSQATEQVSPLPEQ